MVQQKSTRPSKFGFLREFVTHPQEVGAVAPSSRALARAMVSNFDLGSASVVVEIGPGTGAFTETILERAGKKTLFLAIELNEAFVGKLEERFPDADIHHGNAEDTPRILEERGHGLADYVVSGLPWATFPEDLQKRLLTAVYDSLKPGGQFSTFAYSAAAWLPRARRFRAMLEATFAEVTTSSIVWTNFPPAFAYTCRKAK